jgi:hypothetical protein
MSRLVHDEGGEVWFSKYVELAFDTAKEKLASTLALYNTIINKTGYLLATSIAVETLILYQISSDTFNSSDSCYKYASLSSAILVYIAIILQLSILSSKQLRDDPASTSIVEKLGKQSVYDPSDVIELITSFSNAVQANLPVVRTMSIQLTISGYILLLSGLIQFISLIVHNWR